MLPTPEGALDAFHVINFQGLPHVTSSEERPSVWGVDRVGTSLVVDAGPNAALLEHTVLHGPYILHIDVASTDGL